MIPLLALWTLQGPPPTVGDTIWLERAVQVGPGVTVRAGVWTSEGPVAPLGEPVLRRQGESLIIAYPAAAWQAGTHEVTLPGPVRIRADGTTDSLPPEVRVITVASVLPSGSDPDQLPVQPETGLVVERYTTPVPLLVLLGSAALLVTLITWWWRRRGPRLGPLTAAAVHRSEPPLAAWSAAGERRAVAAIGSRELRQAMRRLLPGATPGLVTTRLLRLARDQRPEWPSDELTTVLQGLDAAAFAAASREEAAALAGRARGLAGRLPPAGGTPEDAA